jgi:dienelactone hydrolase
MKIFCRRLSIVLLLIVCCVAAAPSLDVGLFGSFGALDSLKVEPDASPDAQSMLDELSWEVGPFKVKSEPYDSGGNRTLADALVTFASPKPDGDAVNDKVVMEWFVARNGQGEPIEAPAMLVLHILDGRMTVARLIARTFAFSGTHAFVLHLPHYGRRRASNYHDDDAPFLVRVHQGVSDARRAKDAIAALPYIEQDRIGVQGTSLGAFVAAMSASMDRAFDPVFITLGGADIHGMLTQGQRDSKKVRQRLEQQGYGGDALKQLAWRVEPSRIAHRLDPQRTWLYSAEDDQVIPAANARVLAKTARLDAEHHIWMTGNHYTCALHLPRITAHMTRMITAADNDKDPEQ